MPLILTYFVQCDGEHPEIEDESCEAEFEHTAFKVSDIAGFRNQMEKRGWRIKTRDRRQLYLCPLHPKGTL